MKVEKKFAKSGENNIAYADIGNGPNVVFIHGFPTGSFLWEGVIAKMAGDFRCVAPDLLGFGDTEISPTAKLDMASQAEAIVGLMDAIGVEKASVVAHDQGGAAAQILAAKHPSRVEKLALADVVAYDNWPVAGVATMKNLAALPMVGARVVANPTLRKLASLLGGGIDAGFHDPKLINRQMRADFNAVNKSAKSRANYARYILDMSNASTVEIGRDMARILAKTLVIWGDDDVFIDIKWGRKLAAEIPNAQGPAIIEGCGHFSPLEKPDKFAELLRNFLLG